MPEVGRKQQDGRGNHLRTYVSKRHPPKKRTPTTPFDKMAQWLYPNDTTPALSAIFPTTSPGVIRNWRRGNASTPQWALDRLQIKVFARIAELQAEIERASVITNS